MWDKKTKKNFDKLILTVTEITRKNFRENHFNWKSKNEKDLRENQFNCKRFTMKILEKNILIVRKMKLNTWRNTQSMISWLKEEIKICQLQHKNLQRTKLLTGGKLLSHFVLNYRIDAHQFAFNLSPFTRAFTFYL